jgi:hypothetical protein
MALLLFVKAREMGTERVEFGVGEGLFDAGEDVIFLQANVVVEQAA